MFAVPIFPTISFGAIYLLLLTNMLVLECPSRRTCVRKLTLFKHRFDSLQVKRDFISSTKNLCKIFVTSWRKTNELKLF